MVGQTVTANYVPTLLDAFWKPPQSGTNMQHSTVMTVTVASGRETNSKIDNIQKIIV